MNGHKANSVLGRVLAVYANARPEDCVIIAPSEKHRLIGRTAKCRVAFGVQGVTIDERILVRTERLQKRLRASSHIRLGR